MVFPRAFSPRVLLGAALFALCLTGAPLSAEAKPKTHTVYAGQRLGSIAKRYNVTVDELCRANNITPSTVIKPGQTLIIPGTDDGSGDRPKDSGKEDKKGADTAPSKPQGKAQIHVVAKGHTLSAIAGRYAVTVSALCNANGLERSAALTVGDKIIVPHKTDKNGEYARKQRLAGKFKEETKEESASEPPEKKSEKKSSGEKTWQKYVKPAWRKGYIKIRRYGRFWEGYVIGPSNQVLGHASTKINFVMGAKQDGPHIDPKLIRLVASISDKFGGRELRIVSGYRTKSFVAASKHKQGKAIDFSIPGIPNDVLRDYLRTIDGVGVGYYPNSSFVHLDVRGYNSYWVDHAGPGEAPRKSGKKATKKKPADAVPEEQPEEDGGPDEGDEDGGPQEDSESEDEDGAEEHDHDHEDSEEREIDAKDASADATEAEK